MAKLERKVAELNDALLAAGDDHEELQRLGVELGERQAELDATEERWLSLSEELEDRG